MLSGDPPTADGAVRFPFAALQSAFGKSMGYGLRRRQVPAMAITGKMRDGSRGNPGREPVFEAGK
jgi:hypothetical protein